VRIKSLDIYHVRMPLVRAFRTSFGTTEAVETILVQLTSEGAEGWGESAPWEAPSYSPECAQTAFTIAHKFLAPRIVGAEIGSGQELQVKFAHVRGNPFAKAAFDLAWWDLHSKLRDAPLWRELGGIRSEIAVGADFGIQDRIEDLLALIEEAVSAGFPRIKLKYAPGWELEMIRVVRDHFPALTVHIDCNSAYSLDDLPMFMELDQYGLAMIEQPLAYDDLVNHAELQRRVKTPICLDESITSPDKVRKAAQLEACRWVNIKPGRVGGITPALVIHDICQKAGIGCWIGGMAESAVGASACAALATLPNVKYPVDVFPGKRFYEEDLASPEIVLAAPGRIALTNRAGCGAKPRMEELDRLTLSHVHLKAQV